jgi:hypothetical protein
MRAIIALLSSIGIGIDIESIVRAGLHAGFAADAAAPVKIYYGVLPAKEGRHGAYRYAGSVIAMIASQHGKETPGRRIFALLYVFDPGAIGAEGYVVFCFTGDSACVTADTFAVVYNETISHIIRAGGQRSSCAHKFLRVVLWGYAFANGLTATFEEAH